MNRSVSIFIAAAVMAAAPGALGGDTASTEDDRIDALEREVAELRRELGHEDWLTEERAEEIRALVHDVLADADTRASLLQSGMTAGHDGKFFLASADGAFRLELSGQLQVRYIYNNRDDSINPPGDIDDDVSGFQIRRSKLKGKGHIGSPKIGYAFSLAGDRDDKATAFEDYYLNYKFDNGIKVQAGRFKQPYARENLISSSRQLAVERSLVLEAFNVDRSEGVMATWQGDSLRFAGAFNDGIDGDFSDFDENIVDFAFTGRVDWMLAGEWKQMKDFTAWRGEDTSSVIGGAFHYQQGESDSPRDGDDVLLLTVDGSLETNGWTFFVAGYYSDIDFGPDSADNWGLEAMIGYNFNDSFEPFFRYEHLAMDDSIPIPDDSVNVFTLGFNWYQKKHAAKFTFDTMFVADTISDEGSDLNLVDPSSGLGLLDDTGDEDGQFVLRAQYQLLF